MAIQLPKLTTDIDCGPLGYPGMFVTCWLNPPWDDWTEPEKRKPPQKAADLDPWDRPYYSTFGRVILSVYIPAMGDAPEQTLKAGTAQAMYELERKPGFDPQIITFVLNTYAATRELRVEAELGNSRPASDEPATPAEKA